MTTPIAGATTVRLVVAPERVRILPGDRRSSKAAAITDIVRILAEAYHRPSPDEWVTRIRRREALGTTGIGRHFALVHDFQRPCEIVATENADFDLWLFLVPGGVDWDALDGQPVHVIACPVFHHGGEHPTYLDALSAIQRTWGRITPAENTALAGMTVENAACWFNAISPHRAKVAS